MIIVSVGQRNQEFAALDEAVEFAALLWPTVNGRKVNWQHRKLTIPRNLTESRTAFNGVLAELGECITRDDVIVLVSRVDLLRLNPLLSQGFDALIAMLILAFPEVRWLFGTLWYRADDKDNDKDHNAKLNEFRKAHGLHHLFTAQPTPLFDGSGLRDWIRHRMLEDSKTQMNAAHLPRRKQLAVGFDEESDYAYLHAYAAYRFGFRAEALSTKAQADCVLGPAKKDDPLEIVFEDLFLNLPDASGGYSCLGLNKEEKCPRHEDFPRLEQAENRILVTSGQRMVGDDYNRKATERYIRKRREDGYHIDTLPKPHGGIFSLWKRAGLHRRLVWTDNYNHIHRGTGDGFLWPPPWRQIEAQLGDGKSGGHSAPGILLIIAESLIDRAGRLVSNVHTVEEAVLGAVLATEALELLGGKTPTMAIAALTLKHQFEVIAVLQFAGVEYHFPVEHRIKEIGKEVKSIGRWFAKGQRKSAAFNAEMSVLNVLIRVFREYNQFDEEQICMNRVRHLQHTLWMRTTGWGYVFLPVLRYAEFLLSSFPRFVGALLIWIIALTFLFWWEPEYPTASEDRAPSKRAEQTQQQSSAGAITPQGTPGNLSQTQNVKSEQNENPTDSPKYFPQDSEEDLTRSFGSAFAFFLGSNPPEKEERFWGIFIAFLATTAGLAHLGVFISHLYSIVARK